MAKKVAVITDATGAGEFFPCWRAYYGSLFGEENLYVMAYRGVSGEFSKERRFNVLDMKIPYSNDVRISAISQIIDLLFKRYDVIVRCDVDEFIMADPENYDDLADFIERSRAPYVTALGMDVIQCENEADLELGSSSLLQQRSYCVATASISKTCILTHGMRWSIGFHWTDHPPRFDDVYLFHFKFADVTKRVAWFDHMRSLSVTGSMEDVRYSDGASKIIDYARHLRALPRNKGAIAFRDTSFFARVAEAVEVDPLGIYVLPFDVDSVLREIPPPFKVRRPS